ncbi:hypothetical protein HPB50_017144 [Hyalomma asiaticum]|uniref:Uncharacterized protein n=1 Tax=Hyalomma asiaticum TaxID=266040 RepID=A0ACB7T6L8_HYAAI|nr:hypothetical protein HPB50_017144 [Hyalomma asiaticum]
MEESPEPVETTTEETTESTPGDSRPTRSRDAAADDSQPPTNARSSTPAPANLDGDHTYSMESRESALRMMRRKAEFLQELCDELSSEITCLRKENEALTREVAHLKMELFNEKVARARRNSAQKHVSKIDDFTQDEKRLQFYTGFHTANRFNAFISFVERKYGYDEANMRLINFSSIAFCLEITSPKCDATVRSALEAPSLSVRTQLQPGERGLAHYLVFGQSFANILLALSHVFRSPSHADVDEREGLIFSAFVGTSSAAAGRDMAEPGPILTSDATAERKAERLRERRARMTDEQRARLAAAKRLKRAQETDEDRARLAEAQRRRRARLDEETKAALRELHRQRKAARRLTEGEEEAAARRAADRIHKAARREMETEETRAARREADRRRKALRREQQRIAESLWRGGGRLSCDVVVVPEDNAVGAVCCECGRLWFEGGDAGETPSDDVIRASGMCPACRPKFGDVRRPPHGLVDEGVVHPESTAPSLRQPEK